MQVQSPVILQSTTQRASHPPASRPLVLRHRRRPSHRFVLRTMAIDKELEASGGWEGLWKAGLQPGQKFDMMTEAPSLAHKLETGELDVKGKAVLVPGCGRGYDVVAFAKAGAAATTGLEISPTAVERAKEYRDSAGLDEATAAKAKFEEGDFFEYTPPDGGFDVGYDYTFLCALQPEQRQRWAQTWARLIKPNGELVTLIFPVDPKMQGGPPFPVKPLLYKELLEAVGFENTMLEPVPNFLSHEARRLKEYFGRWKRVSKL